MDSASRFNVFSIVCGLWFVCTGSFWPYYTNLFIAYPVGVLGMYLWYRAEKAGHRGLAHNLALGLHMAGLCISLLALFLFK